MDVLPLSRPAQLTLLRLPGRAHSRPEYIDGSGEPCMDIDEEYEIFMPYVTTLNSADHDKGSSLHTLKHANAVLHEQAMFMAGFTVDFINVIQSLRIGLFAGPFEASDYARRMYWR